MCDVECHTGNKGAKRHSAQDNITRDYDGTVLTFQTGSKVSSIELPSDSSTFQIDRLCQILPQRSTSLSGDIGAVGRYLDTDSFAISRLTATDSALA